MLFWALVNKKMGVDDESINMVAAGRKYLSRSIETQSFVKMLIVYYSLYMNPLSRKESPPPIARNIYYALNSTCFIAAASGIGLNDMDECALLLGKEEKRRQTDLLFALAEMEPLGALS